MIERFGKAIGLRIPIWKGRQVEAWYCPRGTKIPTHFHKGIDSFIVYVAGTMSVTVEDKTRQVFGPFRKRESTGKWILATRFIPAMQRHSAEVLGSFAFFLNFERCLSNRQSASKDFVLVP